jgi:anion-transporting  ArsA/GET3 family ATPase
MTTPLPRLLERRSIAVVLGDGGVGKTTVAAALAAVAAASGRRVLCVTVDPANRLRDSLGLSGRFGVEEPVSLAGFPCGPGTAGSLHAMILDAATELDRLVRRMAPSPEAVERITGNDFYRKAATRMTGTHEYLAMERLLDASESGRYDLVVLDTPPERHALDFLDAPDRLGDLLGNEVFRMFVSASSGLSRMGLGVLRFRRLVVSGIARFTGEETFHAVLDFVLAFAPMFDRLRERAGRMRDWLRGDEAATFLVCRTGGPCREHVRASVDALASRGIRPAAILLNRVHTWPPCGDCPAAGDIVDAGRMKDALLSDPALGLHDRATLSGLAGRALALAGRYRLLSREDAERLAALREQFAPTPVYGLPLLRDEVRDLASLSKFAGAIREAMA